MAEKRMFAKSIVLSDSFLDMPMSARCLYFTLNMVADDDGFVGGPRSIMRQCGATEDDMKILIAKKYVIAFSDGVIVIKHWRINNFLRKDRHHDTTYQEQMKLLKIDEKEAYTLNQDGTLLTESNIDEFKKPTVEEIKDYIIENCLNVDAENFFDYYESNGWMIGKTKMNDWKATVRRWHRNEKTQKGNVVEWDELNI